MLPDPAPPEPSARWSRVQAALPVLLTALLLVLTYDPRVLFGGDDALYWALGRSIWEDGSYRNLVAPGAPPETSVPWGYPGLLAAFVALTGADYAGAKFVSAASMVLAAAALGAWGRALGLRGWLGMAALLVVAINGRTLYFGSQILSEAPYMAFSFGALWAMERWSADRRLGWALLAAFLAGFSYLVRPIGLSLFLALLGYFALTRRWRELLGAGGVVGLLVGSWHLWARAQPSEEENLYLHYLVKRSKYQTDDATAGILDYAGRFLHNAWEYLFYELPQLAMGINSFRIPLAALLLGLAVVGLARRPLRMIHLYLPMYFGVLFLWLPESVTNRYLVVVQPLLVVLGVLGAARLAGRRWIWPLAVALLQVPGLMEELLRDLRRFHRVRGEVAAGDPMAGRSASERTFHEMAVWAKENLASDAVFCTRKDRTFWYWAERPAVPLPATDAGPEALASLRTRGVSYLVVDSLRTTSAPTRERMTPALQACPDCFVAVYTAENGDAILRFTPPPDPLSAP